MKQRRKKQSQPWGERLLQWYDEHKRQLPWRQTTDPYAVLVSELMLQQTQVTSVIPYYRRFLERFPTLYHLAQASEQEVLQSWEGLGYYRRARYLHRTARQLVFEGDGRVPDDRDSLLELPGVGPYTAAAILSIAFNQPEPAVDGNVTRVMSRMLAEDGDVSRAAVKRNLTEAVRAAIPEGQAYRFTPALMELGSLVCQPSSPDCEHCPLVADCLAATQGIQSILPVKSQGGAPVREQRLCLLLKDAEDRILIRRRPEGGLLAGLWELPGITINDEPANDTAAVRFERAHGLAVTLGEPVEVMEHAFSHRIWELTIRSARVNPGRMKAAESKEAYTRAGERYRWMPVDEADRYPFARVFRRVLQSL